MCPNNTSPVFLTIIAAIGMLLLAYCGGGKDSKRKSPRIKKLTRVTSPENGSRLRLGDSVSFSVAAAQDSIQVDSFVVNHGTKRLYSSTSGSSVRAFEQTGHQSLSYTVYLSNGKKERHSRHLTLLSDVEPEQYTYIKIETYTHDPDAFTQGLYYDNGFLYESTGRRGTSSLRQVELSSGKVLQSTALPEHYFAEGITLYRGEIYMLTWEARKGFVFDRGDFGRVREFTYPTEGWGITTIGDSLVMSDGTENLYFIEPASFTEIGRLQVYDQKSAVDRLNELEFIDGDIYANVYQTDDIVIIDPASGRVKGRVSLAGIFNRQHYDRPTDVLNGIAYDGEENRLFVTGKLWPKLYEIELVKQNEPSI